MEGVLSIRLNPEETISTTRWFYQKAEKWGKWRVVAPFATPLTSVIDAVAHLTLASIKAPISAFALFYNSSIGALLPLIAIEDNWELMSTLHHLSYSIECIFQGVITPFVGLSNFEKTKNHLENRFQIESEEHESEKEPKQSPAKNPLTYSPTCKSLGFFRRWKLKSELAIIPFFAFFTTPFISFWEVLVHGGLTLCKLPVGTIITPLNLVLKPLLPGFAPPNYYELPSAFDHLARTAELVVQVVFVPFISLTALSKAYLHLEKKHQFPPLKKPTYERDL